MERFSAAGATASGYSKRDGRPRDAETLTARPGPSGILCLDSNSPLPKPTRVHSPQDLWVLESEREDSLLRIQSGMMRDYGDGTCRKFTSPILHR